ncbi:hypothetical protein [Synechococcus sp. GFB01]|uniref:hypothetical protein n=1 Tax=Synechococcus sp. GFB01 TaxID=1662190 RepID=UPI00190FD748|nr:hypothetical protein [Synechococcus sp. GFB01]
MNPVTRQGGSAADVGETDLYRLHGAIVDVSCLSAQNLPSTISSSGSQGHGPNAYPVAGSKFLAVGPVFRAFVIDLSKRQFMFAISGVDLAEDHFRVTE